MPVDGSKAARHEYKCASCQGVGGSDPGSLGRFCDAERGSDMEAATHASAEGDHGDKIRQDKKNRERVLALLG